jgi:hypothetical protein
MVRDTLWAIIVPPTRVDQLTGRTLAGFPT